SARLSASGRVARAQGLVAASGRSRRGGATVEIGSEPAQLAVMSPQAISPHKVQQFVGVIGAPRLGDGRNGRPLHGQGLSVMNFNARGLLPLPPRLDAAGLGVTFGRGRAR